MPDQDGYPTEEELAKLSTLAGDATPKPVIKYLQKLWHWPDYVRWRGGWLSLSTGGWSGNEQLIGTLMSTMFWWLYWQKSERGGHYLFKIPKRRDKYGDRHSCSN